MEVKNILQYLKNPKLFSLFSIVTILSFSLGVLITYLFITPLKLVPDQFEILSMQYPYLSKRILQEHVNDYLINFLLLRRELHKAIKPYQSDFAMYFEYLPTGSSININEKVEFSAASLIKVPIVMAYYHYKERTGITSDPTVVIEAEHIDDGDGELWKKGPGTKINLGEAVKLVLIESDNTAAIVIARNIPHQDFEAVYEGLDVDLYEEGNEVIITAKQYSSILKALYFSSVLSKESSNYILSLLATKTPRDKITLGVPSKIKIANKTGILAEALYQDCGIIYVPKRPYLLCLISRSDEKGATRRMKEISAIIYDYVSGANTSQPTRNE